MIKPLLLEKMYFPLLKHPPWKHFKACLNLYTEQEPYVLLYHLAFLVGQLSVFTPYGVALPSGANQGGIYQRNEEAY